MNHRAAWAIGALVIATSSAARAQPTALPWSRVIVDLPSPWRVYAAPRVDILVGLEDNTLEVRTWSSCADAFKWFAGQASSPTDDGYGGPVTGWSGKVGTHGDGRIYITCADHLIVDTRRDGAAAKAVSLTSSVDSSRLDWRADVMALMHALASARYAHLAAEHDDYIPLPATGLAMMPGFDLWITSSKPGTTLGAGTEVVHYQPGADDQKAVDFTVMRDSHDCESAVPERTKALAGTGTPLAGGGAVYPLPDGDQRVYCTYVGFNAEIVVAPSDAALRATGGDPAEGEVLLATLADMEASAPVGVATALPASGWTAELPPGWTVHARGASGDEGVTDETVAALDQGDLLDVADGSRVEVVRSTQTCAALAGDGTPYDPSWMLAGWSAVTDANHDVRFCAQVTGGTIEVEELQGKRSPLRALTVVLASLYNDNTPFAAAPDDHGSGGGGVTPGPGPGPDHGGGWHWPWPKHLLPVPILLSGQVVGMGGDHGVGIAGRLQLEHALGERFDVAARGELAYDSQLSLSYDAQARLRMHLGAAVRAMIIGGVDELGVGATTPALLRAPYLGGGFLLTTTPHRDTGGIFFDTELAWLWRAVPDGTMTPDEYAGHEWRFAVNAGIDDERWRGATFEVRSRGDVLTVLLGLRLRL